MVSPVTADSVTLTSSPRSTYCSALKFCSSPQPRVSWMQEHTGNVTLTDFNCAACPSTRRKSRIWRREDWWGAWLWSTHFRKKKYSYMKSFIFFLNTFLAVLLTKQCKSIPWESLTSKQADNSILVNQQAEHWFAKLSSWMVCYACYVMFCECESRVQTLKIFYNKNQSTSYQVGHL